ncbi:MULTISPECIES: LCP family protein [unclassified Enterococcus]|uniref:LCP family protein n=1 Tax=unclassified Enterococcus TaxID=2608891 RepID=UPI0015524F58|nr:MULTISPECIES: LCP family protein [unclassified Enterococcus]MBS7576802.1 LCP family protein [Enterococcus sp. MMGLQ5-2]MBS7584209.1 LCP family protein [Enterococcus sp. MMGLQ5-1]NPD12065.1 LCP family protein [Enterococcus sp. MMGLQ5-1]NPD36637.1 LCP family protein [Enterococcus sp. MMGLQ5-2]
MSRLEKHKSKPKKSLTKKIIIILLSIFGISIVAAGSYIATAYFAAESSLKETYESFGNEATKDREEVLQATQPFSILLMGIDTGGVGRTDQWEGRSDSMMIATINPTEKKTTIVSLDRDLLVNMVGPEGNAENGIQDKLNHAYAYGQTEMSILTIQKLLDIPIDKYAIINMDGLSALIDAVGGIDVVNNYGEFTVEDGDFVATVPASPEVNGELQKIHLDGKTGLAYARMRYQDPEGDVGRQKRQREVVTKILEKMLSLDSVSNYQKILTAVKTNLKTNIESNATNIKYLLGYKDSFGTIDSKQLQGSSTQIDGIYYQIADAAQLLEIQNVLKTQLGQATADVLDANIITSDTYGYSSAGDTTTSSDYTYNSDSSAGTYSDNGTGAVTDGAAGYQ